MPPLANVALQMLTQVSALWLLIDVRRKLVQTVVVSNDEVAAEVAAAETGEGVQREMKQVFAFPVDLL